MESKNPFMPVRAIPPDFIPAFILFCNAFKASVSCRLWAECAGCIADHAEEDARIQASSGKQPLFCITGSGELKVYDKHCGRWARWQTWVRKYCPGALPEGW
jgi:hypothetical protein